MLPIIGKYAIFCWATIEFLEILKERTFDRRKNSFMQLHHMISYYWSIPGKSYEKEKQKKMKKHFGIEVKDYATQDEALLDIIRMIEWAYGDSGQRTSITDKLSEEEEFLFGRLAIIVERFDYRTIDDQVRNNEFSVWSGFSSQ